MLVRVDIHANGNDILDIWIDPPATDSVVSTTVNTDQSLITNSTLDLQQVFQASWGTVSQHLSLEGSRIYSSVQTSSPGRISNGWRVYKTINCNFVVKRCDWSQTQANLKRTSPDFHLHWGQGRRRKQRRRAHQELFNSSVRNCLHSHVSEYFLFTL